MGNEIVDKINNNPWVVLSINAMGIIGFGLTIAFENWIVKIVGSISLAVVLAIVVYLYFSRKYSAEKVREELYNEFKQKQQATSIAINDFALHATELGSQIKTHTQMNASEYEIICKNVCREIRGALQAIYNKKINVCIKMIATDSVMDADFNKWKTRVLARDCDQYLERSAEDNVQQAVSDNTSFLEILDPINSDLVFSSPNIEETVRKYNEVRREYRNPNKKYKNFYKSTIVSPISIETKYVSKTITDCAEQMGNGGSNYHVIGFLCIDSKHDFSNEMLEFTALTYDCVTIGTILYAMFENRIINEIEQA